VPHFVVLIYIFAREAGIAVVTGVLLSSSISAAVNISDGIILWGRLLPVIMIELFELASE